MFLLTQLPSLHSGAHSFLPDQNLTSESDQSSVDCCKMPSLQLLNCWTCLIMKCWKYNPHERRCSSGWSVCVCVCVCVCAGAREGVLCRGCCGGGVYNWLICSQFLHINITPNRNRKSCYSLRTFMRSC